jgi:hypothetical protein
MSLVIFLAMLRWNTEAVLKTYELFIQENLHYVPIYFVKKCLK